MKEQFIVHYKNTPMQYTAIFQGLKNDNFQLKNCDIFLIFAQNIKGVKKVRSAVHRRIANHLKRK